MVTTAVTYTTVAPKPYKRERTQAHVQHTHATVTQLTREHTDIARVGATGGTHHDYKWSRITEGINMWFGRDGCEEGRGLCHVA